MGKGERGKGRGFKPVWVNFRDFKTKHSQKSLEICSSTFLLERRRYDNTVRTCFIEVVCHKPSSEGISFTSDTTVFLRLGYFVIPFPSFFFFFWRPHDSKVICLPGQTWNYSESKCWVQIWIHHSIIFIENKSRI